MSATTRIEWADKTWSPIIGCTRVSPGCDRCYAINTARIRSGNPNPKVSTAFAGTVERTAAGLDWTGQVNLLEDRLAEPLRWRKGYRVFVNSQSDLFHPAVPDEFIARVFAVMAATPQHTYQVLTKRHGRMRALLSSADFQWKVFDRQAPGERMHTGPAAGWPLPNVWLGVSVEDQKRADLRIPALLDTPAAVRFLSCEPLLGPIDLDGPIVPGRGRPKLTYWLTGRPYWDETKATTTNTGLTMTPLSTGPRIDWVIVGGESGPGARPMHPDWARSLRDQCVGAGVPFLFKQFGQWGLDAPLDKNGSIVPGPRGMGMTMATDGTIYEPGDLSYPDGPRYGEAIRAGHDRDNLVAVYNVGKKAAGRTLDDRTWDQYPKAAGTSGEVGGE